MKHQILIRPQITEKSLDLARTRWYTFAVATHLTKPEIKTAIETQFNVHVTKVKTLNMKSKVKRSGPRRLLTKTEAWKKAIVRLKANEKIDLFSVEEKTAAKK